MPKQKWIRVAKIIRGQDFCKENNWENSTLYGSCSMHENISSQHYIQYTYYNYIMSIWMNIPSGETTVLETASLICRPPIIHLISAGGLDGAVVHCNGTGSPTRASDGPEMVTWVGATALTKNRGDHNQQQWWWVRNEVHDNDKQQQEQHGNKIAGILWVVSVCPSIQVDMQIMVIVMSANT